MLLYRFAQLQGLIHHLQKEHAVEMSITHHSFASRDQFQLWKCEEEKSQANYVQQKHPVNQPTHTTIAIDQVRAKLKVKERGCQNLKGHVSLVSIALHI